MHQCCPLDVLVLLLTGIVGVWSLHLGQYPVPGDSVLKG